MSALNVFVAEDRADIFTDGAAYGLDGTVGGFMSKVVLCPTVGGVVGSLITAWSLMGLVGDGNLRDLDAIKESLGATVKSAAESAPGV